MADRPEAVETGNEGLVFCCFSQKKRRVPRRKIMTALGHGVKWWGGGRLLISELR